MVLDNEELGVDETLGVAVLEELTLALKLLAMVLEEVFTSIEAELNIALTLELADSNLLKIELIEEGLVVLKTDCTLELIEAAFDKAELIVVAGMPEAELDAESALIEELLLSGALDNLTTEDVDEETLETTIEGLVEIKAVELAIVLCEADFELLLIIALDEEGLAEVKLDGLDAVLDATVTDPLLIGEVFEIATEELAEIKEVALEIVLAVDDLADAEL